MAAKPGGIAAVWVAALALVVMGLWRVVETVLGRSTRPKSEAHRRKSSRSVGITSTREPVATFSMTSKAIPAILCDDWARWVHRQRTGHRRCRGSGRCRGESFGAEHGHRSRRGPGHCRGGNDHRRLLHLRHDPLHQDVRRTPRR
ncbi:hypothetical protein [Mycobacterium sp.]|uniref:hypothetical protein n=1 Tax=Mycobacterium sp. TaxID=1785 RepID=UPI002BA2AC84|nr:hypothetical protein [Mycobacterium sp.]HTH92646.1 hypothetical protein [Mycobacterium sp.]